MSTLTNKNIKTNNHSKTRKKLLKKCGLPDIPETSHCFADSTHHTCCMLGPKARQYSNSTGNPIGSLSVKVQKGKMTKNKLTPWCTCTGSKVCTYYSKKFGKKNNTHIKFIGTLSNKTKNNKNENKAITKLGIYKHLTPGVYNN